MGEDQQASTSRPERKIDPAAKKFAPTTALNHLRDSHPAYECCGCICKREKVQRFARIISSKICAPRCASICGVSAHVFVYSEQQGFVLYSARWPRARSECVPQSVINSVRQPTFCQQLYLFWPSIYQLC